MKAKKAQGKLALDLTCHYYATPEETEKCRDSLKMYLELEIYQKSLSAWELLVAEVRTDASDMPETAIRIVVFQVTFIHKSMTLDNLGLARRTFWDTVDIIREAMRSLATASVKERGTLEECNIFCFCCTPSAMGRNQDLGIDGVRYNCRPRGQGGLDSMAQKAAVKRIDSYMESIDSTPETNVSPMSSRRALQEACWRVKSAEGNTSPLWNALYSTSVLECTSLQLDIDLAIYTMKNVARWYNELLHLFEMSIRSGEMKSQVIKAAGLGKSMSRALDREKADVNGVFVTSDELKRSRVSEQDWGVEKATIAEMENAYKAVRGGLDYQQQGTEGSRRQGPQWVDSAIKLQKRSLVIESAHTELRESVDQFAAQFEQLRLLTQDFILMANIQSKWADLEALAKKPGVDISEVNKVTGVINLVKLSNGCDHHCAAGQPTGEGPRQLFRVLPAVAGTASGVRRKNPDTWLYAAAGPEIVRLKVGRVMDDGRVA
ncbi:hypothetical protein CGRA01v4_00028 [Colletotrichum graminicola]|nr:hypothetical protein CGRA01v4_00028 [Colletotrichum graminicola]